MGVAGVGAEVDCVGPVGNGWGVNPGAGNGAPASLAAAGASVRNLLCLSQGEPAWSLLPLISWADAAGLAVTFVARRAVPALALVLASVLCVVRAARPRLPEAPQRHKLAQRLRRFADRIDN